VYRFLSKPRSNPHTATRWLVAVAVLTAAVGIPGMARAQDRVVTTAVSIEQDQLDQGAYTPDEVVQSGRQFFAAAYLPEDGHGEGDNGPRSGQRLAFWKSAVSGPGTDIPFLRVNGIDSQACFGCHNSAGTYVPEGELYRTQKPGGVGGSADFASVLLSNSQFPDDNNPSETAPRYTHIVRVPPKAFGTGYVQELAIEMTGVLQQQEADATTLAAQNPGQPITAHLEAKGVKFGDITITCPDTSCNSPIRDVSKVEGISTFDLIVRPFQHKGVTATLRSFCKSALDFHFSMQAVEVVGINNDCDLDGYRNEMAVDDVSFAANEQSLQVQQSLGNVAALTAFTGMLRPPVTPNSGSEPPGKAVFRAAGCESCHMEKLTTRPRPQFRIQLAHPADQCPNASIYGSNPGLGSASEAEATTPPALATVNAQKTADANAKGALGVCPSGFYCIDLTNPGSLPPEFEPRLTANLDETVDVPLYSDLKRHDLGTYLAQVTPPQRDDANHDIPNQEWLTTKLWGVADNGPWLHDGRARTLEEAIIMHDGKDGNANEGEAVTAVNNFQALSTTDRDALIAFLESLSVPPAP